jgi:hypothetical protein
MVPTTPRIINPTEIAFPVWLLDWIKATTTAAWLARQAVTRRRRRRGRRTPRALDVPCLRGLAANRCATPSPNSTRPAVDQATRGPAGVLRRQPRRCRRRPDRNADQSTARRQDLIGHRGSSPWTWCVHIGMVYVLLSRLPRTGGQCQGPATHRRSAPFGALSTGAALTPPAATSRTPGWCVRRTRAGQVTYSW